MADLERENSEITEAEHMVVTWARCGGGKIVEIKVLELNATARHFATVKAAS